jgi:hypothetical protein
MAKPLLLGRRHGLLASGSETAPVYTAAFCTLSETLSRKLKRSKKDESERDSLTETEYKALLNCRRIDESVPVYGT